MIQKIHSADLYNSEYKEISEKANLFEPSHDKIENYSSSINDKEFFFYQQSNGELMFLHPLNFKCLYEEYGIKSLPRRIKGKLLQKDLLHLSSSTLRKKYKPLSHIPLSTFVSILEINIDYYISEETYKFFEKEIEERYQLREINKGKRNGNFDENQLKLADYVKIHNVEYFNEHLIGKPTFSDKDFPVLEEKKFINPFPINDSNFNSLEKKEIIKDELNLVKKEKAKEIESENKKEEIDDDSLSNGFDLSKITFKKKRKIKKN